MYSTGICYIQAMPAQLHDVDTESLGDQENIRELKKGRKGPNFINSTSIPIRITVQSGCPVHRKRKLCRSKELLARPYLVSLKSRKRTMAAQALEVLDRRIIILWLPGHHGIKGNKKAEQAAK